MGHRHHNTSHAIEKCTMTGLNFKLEKKETNSGFLYENTDTDNC